MESEIFMVMDATSGERAKLARIAKRLRQVDVASLGKVTVSDVVNLEKDRYLPAARKAKILKVLELNGESNGQRG
jgi:transcriptional regulator with XRE-family HTH domain